MRDFQSMKVWEKGHALTLAVYRVTQPLPSEDAKGS